MRRCLFTLTRNDIPTILIHIQYLADSSVSRSSIEYVIQQAQSKYVPFTPKYPLTNFLATLFSG